MPKISTLVYRGYDKLVFKNARLYNAIGMASNQVSSLPLKYVVLSKIGKLIETERPNAIVVAFPLCSQYISAYKQKTGCDVPMYTCITDIPAHNEWIAEETNLYFVSSEETKKILVAKGVDPNIIMITGVPVRNQFCNNEAFEPADEGKKNLLVMGGGLGLLPGSDLLLDRLASMNNVNVTLIAGKNEDLKRNIEHRYPMFNTVGFTNEIGEYMKKADAVITKPGGVTLFEAINTCTPLYIVNPFLLQEIGNAKYIESKHIGRVLWSESKATANDIESFMNNTEELNRMKNNMNAIRKENEKCDIMTEIVFDINNEELRCS